MHSKPRCQTPNCVESPKASSLCYSFDPRCSMNESRLLDASGQLSDDDLLAIVQTPDTDRTQTERRSTALEILFRRYHAKVYRWCLRILGNAMQAEDLTQGVFLDLWEGRRPYAAGQRFGAWLFVLCRNRCLNAIRADQRRSDEELGDDLVAVLAARSDPHAELERVEIEGWVQEVCRDRLSPMEQKVIALRYTWGMKVDQITETLQLTNASGARTHLRSAEAKLRRSLKSIRRETDGE
jgi:RNA polymerase sigma-70 factor (ECF subfamily)